ncbi:MAG: lysophospholipid acyltransferase family protein [Pseudomonadota bacterium]
MKGFWLKLLHVSAKFGGAWIVRLTSALIAAGYFVFRRRRVAAGLDFYSALFPGRSRLFYLWCVWRQFQDFAAGYSDRVSIDLGGRLICVSEGFENLRRAAQTGKGGIILTSHVGNWEIGAGLVRQEGLNMTMLMGERDPRELARQQKKHLREEGLNVNVAGTDASSPLESLEILKALRSGALISIAGDLAYTPQRSRIPVRFLGREVHLPAAPHLLALLSGAPLLTVFSCREGRNTHHFITSPPRYVQAAGRKDRQDALARSAQEYADQLAEILKKNPYQWHVFEPFLGPPLKNTGAAPDPAA